MKKFLKNLDKLKNCVIITKYLILERRSFRFSPWSGIPGRLWEKYAVSILAVYFCEGGFIRLFLCQELLKKIKDRGAFPLA